MKQTKTITVNLGDLQLDGDAAYSAGATAGGVFTNDIDSLSVDTAANANLALAAIDVSIAGLDAKRSTLGSTLNTLEFAVDNLANASQNASAARESYRRCRLRTRDY